MIAENKVVTLDYTVKDEDGDIIDSSEGGDPLTYLHGANNIIPGLEAALIGKTAGEDFDVLIAPADAYGEYNEAMVQQVPMAAFEGVENVEPGMAFTAQTQGGPVQLIVTDVDGDLVTVDPNHPLAGKTLHFSGTIADVRDATEEELAHGHVHGPHGHHH